MAHYHDEHENEYDLRARPGVADLAMTEDQIKHMVSRFLQWKLPANFSPDGGISFKASQHEPVGTNLLDANQAEAMVRHMLQEMPKGGSTPGEGAVHHIEHDGFSGTLIGHYRTREGKDGVVLQQIGTKVVHVYGEKWLTPRAALGPS